MTADETDTQKIVQYATDWMRSRTVNQLVARVDLTAIGREIAEDESARESGRVVFEIVWDWLVDELRREDQTVREFIGEDLSSTIIDVAKSNDPDEDVIRIMFRSPAAEAMFGNVLYEGITEFLSRADIVSKLLDKIPFIGGLKGKVQDNVPEGIPGLVEGQIKQFLGNFSGAACEKGMNFILSPEHVDDVRQVQGEVAEYLLNKPIKDLAPDEAESEEWKQAIWSSIDEQLSKVEETIDRFDRLYDRVSSRPIEDFLPQEPPPTMVRLLASTLDEFLNEQKIETIVERYYEHQMEGA